MRKPPPPHRRGQAKTPGSGRRLGTPNRKTLELRQLMAALADDASYQHRLREDFRQRRVHPSTEAMIWTYAIGKPSDKIGMSGNLSTDRKLAADREVLNKLSVQELEKLAQESQVLMDKAHAMAERRHGAGVDAAPQEK